MPVHINGHFVLDHEARRNLWTEEHESYRSAWNKHLMSDIIAPAYASALHTLQEHLGLQEKISMKEDVLRQKLNVYHTFWPDVANGSNEYFKFLQ
jgi:sacsin